MQTDVSPKDRAHRVTEKRLIRKLDEKLPSAPWPFVPSAMADDDKELVYGGWVDSLRRNLPFSQARFDTYRQGQEEIIGGLIADPDVEVLMASHPDGEPKFGFACYQWDGDDFILHYVYVRPLYRRHNIASALLQFAGCSVGKRPITVSHWTRDMRHYRKKWDLNYDPWLVWKARR